MKVLCFMPDKISFSGRSMCWIDVSEFQLTKGTPDKFVLLGKRLMVHVLSIQSLHVSKGRKKEQ